MDLRIRKYVLYRVRNIDNYVKELNKLKKKRDQLREEIIEGGYSIDLDGQPHAKGRVSDVTQRKALKLVEVDRRTEKLTKELAIFEEVEKKIKLMGKVMRDVYRETIQNEPYSLDLAAQIIGIGRRQVIQARAGILEMFAKALGEYIDWEEIDNEEK